MLSLPISAVLILLGQLVENRTIQTSTCEDRNTSTFPEKWVYTQQEQIKDQDSQPSLQVVFKYRQQAEHRVSTLVFISCSLKKTFLHMLVFRTTIAHSCITAGCPSSQHFKQTHF